MGLFDTYTKLQEQVGEFLNRPGDTAIPALIELAEVALSRRPELQEELRTTITLDAAQVDLPATTREVKSLSLNDQTGRGFLEVVSPELLPEKIALYGETGRPRFCAVSDNGGALLLAPAPDDEYEADIVLHLLVPALSDAAPTNWVLTKYPDVYLFGALLESEAFFDHDERVPTWRDKYERAMAEIDQLVKRRRYSINTPVMRPRRAIG
jgi:hypothetical protein